MEILINKNDLKTLINEFKNEEQNFTIISFSDGEPKKRLEFYLDGKKGTIDFHIKKKSINMVLVGNKNQNECKKVMNYIADRGFKIDNAPSKQFSIRFSKMILDSLLQYIDTEMENSISYLINGNVIKFIGYNNDEVTLTFWEHKNKALIQGRPFYTYNIIISYLSSLDYYNLDEVVKISSDISNQDISSKIIEAEMKQKLGNAYNYLGIAMQKCISTSLTLLKSNLVVADYSCYLTGIFRGLEGYLKKILSEEYNYTIERNNTFGMFYIRNGFSEIDDDITIANDCKNELKKLHNLYSDKRNVYLHSNINPDLTAIIEINEDAKNLAEDILSAIKISFDIFC